MPQVPAAAAYDPERAIAEAAALPDDAQVQIVLFSGASVGDLEARRLNPTGSLAAEFLSIARRFASQIAARTPVAYGPGRVPAAYEIAHIPAAAVAGLNEILATVEQPIELELFDPASSQANALRFYVVGVYQPNPGWVHFIKAKGATLRLQRTNKIAAVMRGATYDRLAEDPLLFDASFDAVVAEDVVLISSQANFQRALKFVEQARQLAVETIEALSDQLAISNLADFTAAATSDINMVSKIRSIAAKMTADPAYAAAMTTAKVIAFANANNIEIDTAVVDGEVKLVFHAEPARRWRILKLLDDDYLHSQLTELDYEVNSKSPLA